VEREKRTGVSSSRRTATPARFSSSLLSLRNFGDEAPIAPRFIYVRVTSRARPRAEARLIGDEARASKLQLKLSVSIREHGEMRDTGRREKANYSEVGTNFGGVNFGDQGKCTEESLRFILSTNLVSFHSRVTYDLKMTIILGCEPNVGEKNEPQKNTLKYFEMLLICIVMYRKCFAFQEHALPFNLNDF